MCILLLVWSVKAETSQIILDFCSSGNWTIGCTVSTVEQLQNVEKTFLALKESLKNKPTPLIAAKLQQYIVRTEKQIAAVTWDELTKQKYLLTRLQARQWQIRDILESVNINSTTIRRLRSQWTTEKAFFNLMRREVMKSIASSWYKNFINKPYGTNSWIFVDTWWNLFVEHIMVKDDLDKNIEKRWQENKSKPANEITYSLSAKKRDAFPFLYLFKNKEDLSSLGYELTSNRERINIDEEYRRFNIKTALETIGPIRILMPGETLSFLLDSKFDNAEKKKYKRGKIISSDEEVDGYGWWLCGAATALYQWTVTNKWLGIKMRNHSKRYKSLYTATIDGKRQALPWIDATIYSPSLDLSITNTKSYPIIIWMNFDWTYKWVESVFTLAKSEDKWALEYVWKRTYKATMFVKWWWTTTVNGQCHSWLINWKKQERCYKEIK
jgi:VanW like protein